MVIVIKTIKNEREREKEGETEKNERVFLKNCYGQIDVLTIATNIKEKQTIINISFFF